MAGRRKPKSPRADAAKLGCGVVLTYAASSFVPEVGADVPCPRHGYCSVEARETNGRQTPGSSRATSRRSTGELADFLRRRRVTTVHVLRGQRFTLRVVAAAQKEGLVDVDLLSGRVALRNGRR